MDSSSSNSSKKSTQTPPFAGRIAIKGFVLGTGTHTHIEGKNRTKRIMLLSADSAVQRVCPQHAQPPSELLRTGYASERQQRTKKNWNKKKDELESGHHSACVCVCTHRTVSRLCGPKSERRGSVKKRTKYAKNPRTDTLHDAGLLSFLFARKCSLLLCPQTISTHFHMGWLRGTIVSTPCSTSPLVSTSPPHVGPLVRAEGKIHKFLVGEKQMQYLNTPPQNTRSKWQLLSGDGREGEEEGTFVKIPQFSPSQICVFVQQHILSANPVRAASWQRWLTFSDHSTQTSNATLSPLTATQPANGIEPKE